MIRKFLFGSSLKLILILVFFTFFLRSCGSEGLVNTFGFPFPWLEIQIDTMSIYQINSWYIWLIADLIIFYLIFRLFKDRIQSSLAVRSLFNITLWVTIGTFILLSPILMRFVPSLVVGTMYLVVLPMGALYHFLINILHLPMELTSSGFGDGPTFPDDLSRLLYLVYVFGLWGLYWLVRPALRRERPAGRTILWVVIGAIMIYVIFALLTGS